jgi:tetratricopeptide (TPR) repeat protein
VLRDYGQPLQATLKRLSFARRFDRTAFEHLVEVFHTGLPLDAFETVASLSFITSTDDDFLTIHAVVAEAIQELVDSGTRQSSLEVLFAHYESRATVTSLRDISDQSISCLLEAAYLRRQIGINGYVEWLAQITAPLETAARHVVCEQIWRETVSFVERELGSNHPDVLASYLRLAYNLNGQKREPEAEPIIRSALTVGERELGQNHPITASAYAYLVHSLRRLRRHAEAEVIARKALEIRRQILGDDHVDTASSYSSLAYVLTAQKREREAEPLIRQAVDIRTRLLGEDHPETATGYAVLAQNLLAQGRAEDSEISNRKALAIRARTLGEDNPQTATSYIGLASSLAAQHREEEAEPLIRQALEIRQRILGEDHADTAAAYVSLAYNLISRREKTSLMEAEGLIRRALDIRQRLFEELHPDLATSYALLAQILGLQGCGVEAEPFARKALDIRREVLGEEHIDTADGHLSLARNLTDQRRHAEAEPSIRNALDIRRRSLGDDHPETVSAFVMLAANLDAQDRLIEADEIFRKIIEIKERTLGAAHPETIKAYLAFVAHLYQFRAKNRQPGTFRDIFGLDMNAEIGLARIFGQEGHYRDAQAMLCGILNVMRESVGEDHPSMAARYLALAWNLDKQGLHEKAQLLFRRALTINTQVHGPHHTQTVKSRLALDGNLKRCGVRPDGPERALEPPGLATETDTLLHGLSDEAKHRREEVFGIDIIGRLVCAYRLGNQGHEAEAEAIFREVLDVGRRSLGEEHPYVAASCLRLAHFLGEKNLHEAEGLIRKAVEIHTRAYGVKHSLTRRSEHLLTDNLALQRSGGNTTVQDKVVTQFSNTRQASGRDDHQSKRNLQEAEVILRRVLEIRKREFGEENSGTASAYSQLAYNLSIQGRYDEAESLIRSALNIHWALNDLASAARSRGQLKANLKQQGRKDEAETLGGKQSAHSTEGARRRRLNGTAVGSTDKHWVNTAAELDVAYEQARSGNYDEAENIFRRLLEASEKTLGEDHPYVASLCHRLANHLAAQQRFNEAEQLIRKALDINARVHGPDHAWTAKSRKALLNNLKRQGRREEAQQREAQKDKNSRANRRSISAVGVASGPTKAADPDSPFAALASLKAKLDPKDRGE